MLRRGTNGFGNRHSGSDSKLLYAVVILLISVESLLICISVSESTIRSCVTRFYVPEAGCYPEVIQRVRRRDSNALWKQALGRSNSGGDGAIERGHKRIRGGIRQRGKPAAVNVQGCQQLCVQRKRSSSKDTVRGHLRRM